MRFMFTMGRKIRHLQAVWERRGQATDKGGGGWRFGLAIGALGIIIAASAMSLPMYVPVATAATADQAAAAPQFPVQMVDATGQNVTLKAAPHRIITLAPSLTEMAYALGLGQELVAVSAYSDYPPEAKSLPVVGDAFSLSYEKLLAYQPDLVLADETLQPQAAARLRQLGVTVFVVAPKTLPDVLSTLRQLGQLTGRAATADRLVASLQARIRAVEEKVARLPATDRPRVYVEIWNNPLMTAGPGSFLDELIRLAGGVNVAAGTGQAWPQISAELILAANPDVILLTIKDKEEVLKRPGWSSLNAVRRGRVYEVVPDTYVRTGPRLVDALESLFALLHPEQ
ncbi:MAG: cobalamin-binding protein [Limnochordaceae bacterium]|nr:cobalamin-binding protein [Limnochordaceae bacterium]